MSVEQLEAKIRAEGWHPDCLSDDAVFQLMVPFESLHLDPPDRIGLKLDFASNRYLVRFVRGHLGKESAEAQLLMLRLARMFVLTTDSHVRERTEGSLLHWFSSWYRSVLEPAEARLDDLMYGGKTLDQLTAEDAAACEPAVTACSQVIIGELLPGDGEQSVRNLRLGYAFHKAGVVRASRLTAEERDDAKQAVPGDDVSAASYQKFLSDEKRGGPSLLFVSDKGVMPDILRVKTRLDSLGCRSSAMRSESVDLGQAAEPVDSSAEDAAELLAQAKEAHAVLVRIRDREHPGASRRIVAESLLAGEHLSARELARRSGRAFEGIRRAMEEVRGEISKIV